MPLFEETGTFILQLDNLIVPGLDLDGIYSSKASSSVLNFDNLIYSSTLAVLHATFFASSPIHPPAAKSNLIIPIASLSKTTGGEVSVPPTFSVCFMSS